MKINAEELEGLVSDHYANLYRFALSLAHNETEAADLTQQTYYRLASRGEQVRDPSRVKSWLYTTLYREFLALRRHTNRFIGGETEEILSNRPALSPEAAASADAALVMESLQQVNEVFRAPLALFYIEDLSYREIAEILKIPIGTVMSRLARGKAELRANLSINLERKSAPPNVIHLPKKKSAG